MGSIDVNNIGETYFSGQTRLYDGIATPDGYMPNKINLYKVYFIKLNNLGQRVWGTYYGGDGGEQLSLIHLDNQQNIYLYGVTNGSTLGIATPGAYQTTIGDNQDNFLVKFKDCSSTAKAFSNSPICVGKTLELKASGGTNYSWIGPNGFTSTDQNPIILNVTAVNSGQYSCAITGTGDCDDTKTVDVIVGDTVAPIPNLAALPTITGDCNTTVTTIPTATDTCSGSITATTTNQLSYSLSGTYTIVWNYSDGNGNSITQNQNVTISSQPLPTATSPQPFCIQQNATLNSIAITGQNIRWYDALANGNLLANTTPLQNGITYYASQTINGCESERTPVLINIQNTATPIAISPQTFCASQNPTINTIVITGTSIKWYDSLTNRNLIPITTSLLDGQTYYATQTLNGCESPTRLAVTVALISTLPANNYEELFCDDLNDGTETVDLSSYNSKVISNTNNYNFTYYSSISGAENETSSNKITNFSTYKLVLGDNKIYVRINSNTPCYAVAELKLTLFSKPIINIQDIVPICENNTITIDAGAGFNSYLWSNGETTQTINVANPGNFSVTVTDNYATIACSSTKIFTVKKSNKATINSIETKDWTDSENIIIVNITASSIGNYEYSIDGVNYQTSNQFTGLISGKYTVWVRDKYGCEPTTDEVYLLMFPKFFTPNGDGYNDTWKIKFSDVEAGLTIKIFDRYGKLIKTLADNSSEWNGTFNGTELPATDYWFIVTRANGMEYKGHFSLKR
jgi:gliding motility-associated-like protein